MSSAFSSLKGQNKICRCGYFIPKYVTPVTCTHCKRLKSKSKFIVDDAKREEQRKEKARFYATFTKCLGICGRNVPPHVVPSTCRHCSQLKMCDGPCGKIVGISTTVETCLNCDMIRFPYTKCETSGCSAVVRKVPKCQKCTMWERLVAYDVKIYDKFGPPNYKYSVKLFITGLGCRHTGYSCLTPFGCENVKIHQYLYLPAVDSLISEAQKYHSGILFNKKSISVKKLNKDEFPNTFNLYLESLDLKKINYPGTCRCAKFSEIPHVKNISITQYKNAPHITHFFQMASF